MIKTNYKFYYIFLSFFLFIDTTNTQIYTLSLHDALPICNAGHAVRVVAHRAVDIEVRPRPRVERGGRVAPIGVAWHVLQRGQRSEEHTSELQSPVHLV